MLDILLQVRIWSYLYCHCCPNPLTTNSKFSHLGLIVWFYSYLSVAQSSRSYWLYFSRNQWSCFCCLKQRRECHRCECRWRRLSRRQVYCLPLPLWRSTLLTAQFPSTESLCLTLNPCQSFVWLFCLPTIHSFYSNLANLHFLVIPKLILYSLKSQRPCFPGLDVLNKFACNLQHWYELFLVYDWRIFRDSTYTCCRLSGLTQWFCTY